MISAKLLLCVFVLILSVTAMRMRQENTEAAVSQVTDTVPDVANDSGDSQLSAQDISNILVSANAQLGDCAPNGSAGANENLDYHCQRVVTPNSETTYETYSSDDGTLVSSVTTSSSQSKLFPVYVSRLFYSNSRP